VAELRSWHERVDQYADDPNPRLDDALKTTIGVVAHWSTVARWEAERTGKTVPAAPSPYPLSTPNAAIAVTDTAPAVAVAVILPGLSTHNTVQKFTATCSASGPKCITGKGIDNFSYACCATSSGVGGGGTAGAAAAAVPPAAFRDVPVASRSPGVTLTVRSVYCRITGNTV